MAIDQDQAGNVDHLAEMSLRVGLGIRRSVETMMMALAQTSSVARLGDWTIKEACQTVQAFPASSRQRTREDFSSLHPLAIGALVRGLLCNSSPDSRALQGMTLNQFQGITASRARLGGMHSLPWMNLLIDRPFVMALIAVGSRLTQNVATKDTRRSEMDMVPRRVRHQLKVVPHLLWSLLRMPVPSRHLGAGRIMSTKAWTVDEEVT